MTAAKWRVHTRTNNDLLTHLLDLRGLTETELLLDFTTGLHDPNLLPDMPAARQVLVEARQQKWPVTIFGDYDADGTPAAALLSSVLTRLGINHDVVIPTRAEGYGLKLADVEKIAQRSKLLITVDTGISAVEEIARAKELGLSVIILDHHLPPDKLPAADAVVDPFVPASAYPFNHLCGCALAYKFTEALSADFPQELTEGFRKWLLDLVAISTVADMMVMKGENRVLVHYGLQVLRKTRRPGLRALLDVAGVTTDKMSVGTLGFTLGPRLNATGRLGDNYPALQLLLAQTPSEARSLAIKINQANAERQALVEKILTEAEAKLFNQNDRDDHCLVVVGDWPTGMVGLAAGKLTSRYNRPAIVLSDQGESLTGSSRSTGSYSIIDGLKSQASLLQRFGGHRQAAGLSLPAKNLSQFVDGIKAHAHQHLPADEMVPTHTADAILRPAEISLESVAACEKLQPFGQQNEAPLFIIESAQLSEPRFIGASGDHVKWRATKAGKDLEVIAFGWRDRAKSRPLEQAHLLGHLEKNVWQDRVSLQLRLVDLQPTDHPIRTIK